MNSIDELLVINNPILYKNDNHNNNNKIKKNGLIDKSSFTITIFRGQYKYML